MQNKNNILSIALAVTTYLLCSPLISQDDWPRWRGPNGNGVAVEGQTPPTSWDEDTNVIWKTKVPGRGHASPIIIGDKIFLATAEESDESQSVVCYDRASGKRLWKTEINQGALNPKVHRNNTHASPTIATDGERVFALFNNHESIQLAAVDYNGKRVWTKVVGQFKSRLPFGFGASPIVHDGNVIVTNQNNADSAMTAYDGASGKQVWKIELPKKGNYSTPVVANIGGREQLLISGQRSVNSYDPASGDKLWEAAGKWDITCGTMVWDDELVFASGGYPAQQTLAIKADGSGKMVWENPIKVYEQSMLLLDGHIYAHSDNGAIYCWRAKDGEEMWKQRFSSRRSPVSASPVSANGHIYLTAENGQTLVIKANHEKLEEVARNKLGDESFASMAICDNQIFTRVAIVDPNGERQEWLFCLGEE